MAKATGQRQHFGLITGILLMVIAAVCVFFVMREYPPQTDAGKLSRLERRARAISWRGSYPAEVQSGDDAKAALSRLEVVARYVLGFKLDYVEGLTDETGNYGQTFKGWHGDEMVRATQIDASLKTNARVHVLSHELGHMLQPPSLKSGPDAEVFAEVVAFLVCDRLGLNTLNESANYLAQFKTAFDVIDLHRNDLEWAVQVIAGD